MINQALIHPRHIAIVGASAQSSKPGGKVLLNLLEGGFAGEIYAVNPHLAPMERVTVVQEVSQLPLVDLAILAIPAAQCLPAMERLLENGTRAFIVYSSGFGEAGEGGKELEQRMISLVNRYNACLIGPNCIGVINSHYKGVFTTPIPDFFEEGCELISSSGATAVFIMEAAASTGLHFSNIYSIGNASQISAEDILEYMDLNHAPDSPKVKLLYMESIRNPVKLMKHASSLIRKGCSIAAIKSGYSAEGGRAASSHTGALATSDVVIRALFNKAGIIYCNGRDELIAVACVLQSKPLTGKRIAIITHAGGSAVMLTDALCSRGMEVPYIGEERSGELLKKLHPGSSVANPIDFLATGTAEQLGQIIDFCETLDDIDGIIVVFGSPGLFNVRDVYHVLDEKMRSCRKSIFPVLPSLINAKKEIDEFLAKGWVNFSDELTLGRALPHVFNCPQPTFGMTHLMDMETATIRGLINQASNGYLSPSQAHELLEAAGLNMVKEFKCDSLIALEACLPQLLFPVVMKVIGPVHKTEVNGVTLNITNESFLKTEFSRMMNIPEARGVLIQPMLEGIELYCGAVKQGNFGHLVLAGLGGIFVEVLQDVAYGIAPLNQTEVHRMVSSLKGYQIIKGYRNRKGINEQAYVDAIMRIASLVNIAPEIAELDINPFKADENQVVVVDARIRIER